MTGVSAAHAMGNQPLGDLADIGQPHVDHQRGVGIRQALPVEVEIDDWPGNGR